MCLPKCGADLSLIGHHGLGSLGCWCPAAGKNARVKVACAGVNLAGAAGLVWCLASSNARGLSPEVVQSVARGNGLAIAGKCAGAAGVVGAGYHGSKCQNVEVIEGADSQRNGIDQDGDHVHGGGAAFFKCFLRWFVGVTVHGLGSFWCPLAIENAVICYIFNK